MLAAFVIDLDDVLAVFATAGDAGVEIRARTVAIERRDVAELIAAAVTPATLRDTAAWLRAAADLVKALPSPALDAIAAARRAIIIPEDVLWRIPFEALPLRDGFLGDQAEIVYASSVAALLRPPGAPAIPAARPAPRSWREARPTLRLHSLPG